MCTFIAAWQVFEDEPVVIAANRDEAVDRPSRPPRVIEDSPRIVAPQDERAGGTWLGYNEHGVVASVTNRWTDAELAGDRSRGLLVRDVLTCPSAAAAAATVERQVEEHRFAGFNLVAIDEDDALLLEWDGDVRRTSFDPGVHVVVNVGADRTFDVPEFEGYDPEVAAARRETAVSQARNAQRALDDLAPRSGEDVEEWLSRTKAVLSDHDYGFCVHGDGFGTRSSSIVRLPATGEPIYEYVDGRPCEADVSYTTVDVS